jgi:hypothetical protein
VRFSGTCGINKFGLAALFWLLVVGTSFSQQPGPGGDARYIVRDVEGVVMLIDLETGWTWKRIAPNESKPPRWRSIDRFRDAKEATAWLEENPEKLLPRADLNTRRWAAEVLLGLEYTNKSLAIRRWVTSPTVSIFGGSAERDSMVVHAITEINLALKPASSIQLKLVKPNKPDAAIRLRFMPFSEFRAFCEANNRRYSATDFGVFYTDWDRNKRITGADVLIAVDKSWGDGLQHLVLEELIQTLGPMNDSAYKRDSIFFSGRSTGTTLSQEDKRLMLILYKYLKPDDPASRVERALARYLKK